MLHTRLKKLRMEKDLTQAALARELNVTQQAVAKWEAGKSLPDHAMLLRLAQYYGVSVDYLLGLPAEEPGLTALAQAGIRIRRAMAPDKLRVVDWVKEHSGPSAAGECDVCFAHTPVSCYLATRGAEILGYACYDATAPDFFGPTRVLDSEQGKGIGKALLLRCLHALRAEGYAYAIIGGVGPVAFYEKCVGARVIPDSTPGIYRDFLAAIEKGAMGTGEE